MKARSAEFLHAGEVRLRSAHTLVDSDPATAMSTAYYAALYAARAALSEQDVHSRTHRGTWHEFRARFVATGAIDHDLATAMQRLQSEREQADYDAVEIPPDDARSAIQAAEGFVCAVRDLLDRT